MVSALILLASSAVNRGVQDRRRGRFEYDAESL